MRWMLTPMWRYFDFSGRSCRKEFWLFFLLQFVALAALAVWIYSILVEIGEHGNTGHVIDDAAGPLGIGLSLFSIFVLITAIPGIAVQVRRLHDQDMSGLLALLNLVPVGGLVLLVFMCFEGTKGSNRFGPDPLAARP